MATFLLWLYIISILMPSTFQLSTPEDDSYVAAVVEYGAIGDPSTDTPLDVMRQNWLKYKKIIRSAAIQNADIIVFPECGLTNMGLPANRDHLRSWLVRIPDPAAKEIPCINQASPEILKNASCTAREHRLYLVINLSEEAPCSSEDPTCPADGIFIFNTNIVFDRNGTLIARYRKFNLFVEPGFDVTPTAELSTFDTDFGVRFGTFICFDILFQSPALRLAQELGITDFVYPVAWFSELPYLTAVEMQAAWAYTLDVNLLASGFSNPPNGNAGSGIYSGKLGPLEVTMPVAQSINMLIHRVPKKSVQRLSSSTPVNGSVVTSAIGDLPAPLSLSEVPTSTIGDLPFFQDDFRPYKTVLLDTNANDAYNTTHRVDLCHGEFCCHFEVTTEIIDEMRGEMNVLNNQSGYYYRLAVFDGIRSFAGVRMAGIQVCGIIPCTSKEDITTCGKTRSADSPPINVAFTSILIIGNKFQRYSSLQMPTTLTEVLHPLPSSDYEFSVKKARQDDKNEVEFRSKERVNALIGLAVYGRVFDRDAHVQHSGLASGARRSI